MSLTGVITCTMHVYAAVAVLAQPKDSLLRTVSDGLQLFYLIIQDVTHESGTCGLDFT